MISSIAGYFLSATQLRFSWDEDLLSLVMHRHFGPQLYSWKRHIARCGTMWIRQRHWIIWTCWWQKDLYFDVHKMWESWIRFSSRGKNIDNVKAFLRMRTFLQYYWPNSLRLETYLFFLESILGHFKKLEVSTLQELTNHQHLLPFIIYPKAESWPSQSHHSNR